MRERFKGQYDYITSNIPLRLDQVVEDIGNSNYGIHRLLSAIVQYRRSDKCTVKGTLDLTDTIADMLDKGYF